MSHYYYANAETKENPGDIFFHWNWAAFFFGPLWLAYRKSYFYAFLALLIEVTYGSYVIQLGGGVFEYKMTAFLPYRIILGFIGTSLYFRKWIKNRQNHDQHKSLLMAFLFLLFWALFPAQVVIKAPSSYSTFTYKIERYEDEKKEAPTPGDGFI